MKSKLNGTMKILGIIIGVVAALFVSGRFVGSWVTHVNVNRSDIIKNEKNDIELRKVVKNNSVNVAALKKGQEDLSKNQHRMLNVLLEIRDRDE